MRKYLLGASAAVIGALAVPVLAQAIAPPPPRPPLTRAAAEAMVREKFAKADANKDGAVTLAEVEGAMAAGRADRQAKMAAHRAERFAALDANRDGQLSREEFAAARPGSDGPRGGHGGREGGRAGPDGRWGGHGGMRLGGHGPGGFGQKWFARVDANQDGRVTLAEADAAAMARFDQADANHDGTISPDERKAARQHMREEWKAKKG